MAITVQKATAGSLDEVVEAVATWQHEGGLVQLHPGDLGWRWRLGAESLADDVRVWRRDGQILAAGLIDDPGLARLALSPSVDRDAELAARLLSDLSDPLSLQAGRVDDVEARFGAAFRELLDRSGWVPGEAWTPLHRDLSPEVEEPALRVEIVDAHTAAERAAVQRAAFSSSTFTAERWEAMAAAPPYRRARCLLGLDPHGVAVATATVWSAGPGRPGLLEPLGVHRDHRGRGYGTAISVAAAAALQEMGASSATVCTPTANVGAVAAYASAGFGRLPDVTDFHRST